MEHYYNFRLKKPNIFSENNDPKIVLNKFFTKKILFSILFLFIFNQIYSQETKLLFSKGMLSKTGRFLNIQLSDSSGNINPSAEIYNQSALIYFLVKPQTDQDWTISNKDAEKKLTEIKIVQSIDIFGINQSKIITTNNEISGVVLAYSKSKINIIKDFKFKFEEYESEAISIPEKLWPKYKKYTDIIASAQSASSNANYENAFKNLSKLWNKDTLLSKFSFYNSAKDSLCFYTDMVINKSYKLFSNRLDNFKANVNEQNLNSLFSLKDSIFDNFNYLDSILNIVKNEIDAVTRINSIEERKQFISVNLEKSKIIFRKKKISLFEEKNYQDYQFKIFIEALSKMITSVEKIKQINSFDSINYEKIKNYPSSYKEITEMGWRDDFTSVCKILNENIVSFGYILNDTAINNLSQNKAIEPQPYMAIFKAFNALVKKDKRSFLELINQSIYAVTDKDLLSSLDLYTALVNSEITNNDDYWELLQKAYSSQISGSLQEAKSNYEKAEKLSNSGEILYFLMAECNLKLGDRYSAEIYFKRSNSINPKFILPKLYQIEFLMEDKDYETSLSMVNEALTNNPIWYFYYKKALLLALTGKFNESKQILTGNCLTLNPLNYEQYLVLGDVYNALGDAKSARESYMKAGNIKPNDNGYKSRMENLKQSQEVKPTK